MGTGGNSDTLEAEEQGGMMERMVRNYIFSGEGENGHLTGLIDRSLNICINFWI